MLDGAKNDKENTKVKFYEKVLDKSLVSYNKSFEVLRTQRDKSEQQEPQVELKQILRPLDMNF